MFEVVVSYMVHQGAKLIIWLFVSQTLSQDGSTMLIEAAKGGHTNVVSYLLDYPNNVLSVPATDLSQLTPPSQDQSQVRQEEVLAKKRFLRS